MNRKKRRSEGMRGKQRGVQVTLQRSSEKTREDDWIEIMKGWTKKEGKLV